MFKSFDNIVIFMAITQSLEDVLRQVENLRRDLGARKTHLESIDVYEDVLDSRYTWGSTPIHEYVGTQSVEIDDGPDTIITESARQQLQQVYDSSEWYSARYKAGITLGIENNVINQKINFWIEDISERLRLIKPEERRIKVSEKSERVDYGGPPSGSDDWRGGAYYCEEIVPIYEERTFNFVDQDKRLEAIADASELFMFSYSPEVRDFLKSVYSGNYDSYLNEGLDDVDENGRGLKKSFESAIRAEAGKALSYSPLKIWIHENFFGAIITGITAAGAASGLGYMLYQYLSK